MGVTSRRPDTCVKRGGNPNERDASLGTERIVISEEVLKNSLNIRTSLLAVLSGEWSGVSDHDNRPGKLLKHMDPSQVRSLLGVTPLRPEHVVKDEGIILNECYEVSNAISNKYK